MQLPLDDEGARADNLAGSVLDDEHKVGAALALKEVVAFDKVGLGDVADRGQHAQAVEEARSIVGRAQGAHAVALGQDGRDLGANEVIAEEPVCGHCGGGGGSR